MVSPKELLNEILNKEKLNYCQNCGSCTASCPVSRVIPEIYNPRNLLQRVSLDLDRLILGEELWLCAWCYRCTERCPQGIEPTEIFLLTRNFAVEKGNIPDNPKEIINQIIKTGRSMPYSDFIDEWREEYGLPPAGAISDKALEEQKKIMGEAFIRRLKS